jgi:hypothetical protein
MAALWEQPQVAVGDQRGGRGEQVRGVETVACTGDEERLRRDRSLASSKVEGVLGFERGSQIGGG